jgi:hypothetical protein
MASTASKTHLSYTSSRSLMINAGYCRFGYPMHRWDGLGEKGEGDLSIVTPIKFLFLEC